LLASGVKGKNELGSYTAKLYYLHRYFIREIKPTSDPTVRARALFTWLWIEKPDRYQSDGNFRLSHAIDAQFSKENQIVGNCLGLTLLYNCLLQRMGIMAETLYVENAFGIGPHVLTVLQTEELTVDIENIFPDGFDYRGHVNSPSRKRWGDRELVAAIYHSIGNEFMEKEAWVEALKNFEMAIHLNPYHEKAKLNRAISLDKMNRQNDKKWLHARE